jgi:hypothetical protein
LAHRLLGGLSNLPGGAVKLTICALLLYAGAAAAQERFGTRGTVAPSGSVGVIYSTTPTDIGDFDSYGFSIDPGAMFFVADDIAVGGFAHFSYVSLGQPGSSDRTLVKEVGIAPSVGWNLWLGERVSLFPQATVRASWRSFSVGGNESTDRLITAQAFVPALLHVTSHFFLGLGPTISRDLDSTQRFGFVTPTAQTTVAVKTTTIALQSVIGGWF